MDLPNLNHIDPAAIEAHRASEPRNKVAVLEARDIAVHFDGIVALGGVSLSLAQGEVLGLIGPNGAGKSTLVNVLTGFQRPTVGSVWLGNRNITRLAAHRRPGIGIVRTFQSTRVFAGLTVHDNVEVAAMLVESSRHRARALTKLVLEQTRLWTRADESADGLSTGDAQRLGVARSLALRPQYLLLDEPGAGLNDRESDELVSLLRNVVDDSDMGILLIEHNLGIVRALSQRIHVLDKGRTIGVGTPAEVQKMPAVLAAYLGSERAADAAN